MSDSELKKEENEPQEKFAIARSSFKFIGLGVVIVIIGFLLMLGGKYTDPNEFNPDVFSFRRITLAPIVVVFGFLFVIWAIMRRPSKEK